MTIPKPLNIWFAGTPVFAEHILRDLIYYSNMDKDANHSHKFNICGVLTQPDRPAGRGQRTQATPVSMMAFVHAIPTIKPHQLCENDPLLAELPRPDLVIVVAYGLLLPQWFLDYPRLGCINVHASLLPRWRGAAPIQRAIEAGDTETGISIMQMDAGLDTGAVWLEKPVPITPEDNATTLQDKLMATGSDALLSALEVIINNPQKQPTPQNDEHATYAHKLTKAEAAINWQESADIIARKIRAFHAFPVAYTNIDDLRLRLYDGEILTQSHQSPPGTVIKHDKNGLDIATGDGVLRIHTLQLAGKKITSAGELHNGRDLTGRRCS